MTTVNKLRNEARKYDEGRRIDKERGNREAHTSQSYLSVILNPTRSMMMAMSAVYLQAT